ncbi:MAG: ABC transporter permease [Mollicutes bacterium]|nr:ABC transporter permease [Mollicutes bacterium]
MKKIINLTIRNIKVYFSDKGMFFTSLITPAILLVLYSTFLANVYKDAFISAIPDSIEISSKLLNGLVSGQLVGSLLSVSCITVAFCSNMLMVQDKANGNIKDLIITPTDKKTLAISYFLASFISTLIVNLFALGLCLIYIAINGWFMNIIDILLIMLNVIGLTLFGCILSSLINSFLSTQGQISAVGSIVSSMYGFIAGAYMPMSQFGAGLRNALLFLPTTYATALMKNSVMESTFRELAKIIPNNAINSLKESIDIRLIFNNNVVSISTMYLIVIITIFILFMLYILKHLLCKNK